MKILITGGAGFIGSHLAESYLERGDEVYIIDDLSTGSLENIKHLQADNAYKNRFFATIDTILNHDIMLELTGICDVVIHLAAAVGVQYILDNPLTSIVTNLRGTELVLELCNKFKKKVLIASTSEVYGKHDHAPLVETDDCVYGSSTKSRWSYAAAKLMDEFTALAYFRTKKLDVIIVRFFNIVGARQTGRYGMVLPRFVKKALEREPILVYGDGKQTRTFTHVEDVIESIVKLMESPQAIGEVVNVGGVEEISIFDLANKVKQKVGSTSEIKLVPYDEVYPRDFEDMQRRVPSTEKLAQLIGNAPIKELDKIIQDVIDYFRSSPEIA
jgi:UDP-glucose 4-epimerase